MGYKHVLLFSIILFISGCKAIEIVPRPKTEIIPSTPEVVSTTLPIATVMVTATPAIPTAIPTIGPTNTPLPTATPFLSMRGNPANTKQLPSHGVLLTILLPFLCIGLPWLVLEYFVVRYVQPKGLELTSVLIRAQDGLFIKTVLSMTARRSLSIASTQMSWPRVKTFVEKTLEQELTHRALQYPTLETLQKDLSTITEDFLQLPIIKELWIDFGVKVIRFNIETRYPPETTEALNRKAEATAGGAAFLAYAAAANLNAHSREGHELYRIYQETRGQVDAARNLGTGIGNLASLLVGQKEQNKDKEKGSEDEK